MYIDKILKIYISLSLYTYKRTIFQQSPISFVIYHKCILINRYFLNFSHICIYIHSNIFTHFVYIFFFTYVRDLFLKKYVYIYIYMEKYQYLRNVIALYQLYQYFASKGIQLPYYCINHAINGHH